MKKLTNKQKIEQFKEEIRAAGYPSYKRMVGDLLIGTMYVKEKMDYGFHIFFIHEPSKNNDLAGVDGIVTEMFYDLRNREYWIKRNMKDVKFSERNIDSIFPSDDMKLDMLESLSTEGNKGLYVSAFSYLSALGMEYSRKYGRFFYRLMTDHSYYELLYKAGIKIDSSLRIVNREGTTPMEILGLSKTQWKMIHKYGIDINDLSYKTGEEPDQRLFGLLAYMKKLEEEFGVDKIESFIRSEIAFIYNEKFGSNTSVLRLSKIYGMPEKKLIRYLYFECDVSQGLDAYNAISQFKDYIRMNRDMGFTNFDRYPKHLRTSHDIVARNYKVKLSREEQAEWDERYEENKKMSMKVGDYVIFPPETTNDLKHEGNELGHCVGSYVGKVRKGISTILFLREKGSPEQPLVTIEVKEGRIVQARGKMNFAPKPMEKAAIKKYADKMMLAY